MMTSSFFDQYFDKSSVLSAKEWASLIKQKKISATELTKDSLKKINEVEPKINATIEILEASALALAKKADDLIAHTKDLSTLPPFLGVPCSIKGNLAYKNHLWFGGVHHRKNLKANYTCESIERYLENGLIPVALTNVPEACLWMETDNVVFGKSNNPYDITRTVGGSSGGEGALIGAGAVSVGLGADVGGSIRLPANFCGISGHKPSSGLISLDGHWPESKGKTALYNSPGPMAKQVDDLLPLLNCLQGPTPKFPHLKKIDLTPPVISPRHTKVFFYSDNGESRASAPIRDNIKKVISQYQDMGFTTEEWRPKSLKHSSLIWLALMDEAGADSFESILTGGKTINLIKQFLLHPFGKSDHTLPALLLALMEKATPKNISLLKKLAEEGMSLKEEVKQKLGAQNVLIAPVYPQLPPKHHHAKMYVRAWAYTAIYNIMELPVTAVPTGMHNGLPLGVQIASNWGNDSLTIGMAKKIEQILPWPKL